MFDISFSELAIIGVVALVVIGPERLPKVARTVGHLMGRAQRYVNDVKADIQREVELDEFRKLKQSMDTAASELNTSLRETENTIRSAGQTLQADLDAAAGDAKRALDLTADARTGIAAASGEAGAAAPAADTVPPANAAPAEPAPQAVAAAREELPLAEAETKAATPAPAAPPAAAPAAPAATPPANATTGTPT